MEPTRTPTNEAARQGTLGRYRLLTDLGAGGMATVSLAAAQGPGGFNKLLVIKQIHEQYARDPEFVAMFLDEARLCARLQHPNVVQTNEVNEDSGRYFIAMEFLEGHTLGRVRARLGRRGLPLGLHLQVICDVLSGLHYAHELCDYESRSLGVVHRDANPENIFITYDGAVKVMDFGIAKAVDQSCETLAGTIKGKVTYMPPEQARGEPLDRRADVFAVGVMLWEAATGVRMWKGLPQTGILKQLIAQEIPDPRSVTPDLPDQLDAIIRKACAPNPDDRYATAAELQAAVEDFLAAIGGRAHPRELGRLVAACFADDRIRLRTRIQDCLRDPSEHPPLLPEHPLARSSASAFAHSVPRPSSGGTVRRSLVALALAGSALVVAGLAPAVLRRGASGSPAITNAIAAASPTVEVTAAPSPPTSVTLNITAQPPQAQIFLDGQRLDRNPFAGQLPAGPNEHVIRVEAPGYEPRTERLALAKSRDMVVVLQPSPPPARPIASAVTAPSAVIPAGPMPGSRRRLDANNPYPELR